LNFGIENYLMFVHCCLYFLKKKYFFFFLMFLFYIGLVCKDKSFYNNVNFLTKKMVDMKAFMPENNDPSVVF